MKIKNNNFKSQEKTIIIEYTDNNLTNYAGLIPVASFMLKKLNIKKLFDDECLLERGDNFTYSSYDIISMILVGILAGAKHINQICMVAHDQVLQNAFGWKGAPAPSTISRFLDHFTQRQCQNLLIKENVLREKVWKKVDLNNVIIDCDSTVKTVYGHQEGAAKGYNPTNRGKLSYHPLLAFVNETKEVLLGHLRSGDCYTSNGAVGFMEESLAYLPKKVTKVLIRGDRGFFRGELFDYFEGIKDRQVNYLIKVKLKGLNHLLENQKWTEQDNGIATAEFMHACKGWKKERRFVAIRKLVDSKKIEENLFGQTRIPIYEYCCFVTDLDLLPLEIFDLYGERGECENWIEELKNQFYGCMILTEHFWANDALFKISILAYNIKNWMTYLCDRKSWREEGNTFRFWFIKLAGRLIYSGRRFILQLQANYFYRQRWDFLNNNINNLQLE